MNVITYLHVVLKRLSTVWLYLTSISLNEMPLLQEIIGSSLNISLSLGCDSIRCHFSIKMCLRLGTDGLYYVTKGNISFCTLVLSLRAFFLSENFTSESVL